MPDNSVTSNDNYYIYLNLAALSNGIANKLFEEQTAENILELAKSSSAGNPSAISVLKDAALEGFAAAEETWGGKLPDVCYQTIKKVMDGFNELEESGNT